MKDGVLVGSLAYLEVLASPSSAGVYMCEITERTSDEDSERKRRAVGEGVTATLEGELLYVLDTVKPALNDHRFKRPPAFSDRFFHARRVCHSK